MELQELKQSSPAGARSYWGKHQYIGFPAYGKLDMRTEVILLNCAECEPLLKLHRQLLEQHAEEILRAFDLMARTVLSLLRVETMLPTTLPTTMLCISSKPSISATDAMKLGVAAPLRESGNTAGSAPIAVVGPKGALYLEEGCIGLRRGPPHAPGSGGYALRIPPPAPGSHFPPKTSAVQLPLIH